MPADAPIRDYIAEHEQIVDAGDDALRALGRGDISEARESLSHMHEILTQLVEARHHGGRRGREPITSEVDPGWVCVMDSGRLL